MHQSHGCHPWPLSLCGSVPLVISFTLAGLAFALGSLFIHSLLQQTCVALVSVCLLAIHPPGLRPSLICRLAEFPAWALSLQPPPLAMGWGWVFCFIPWSLQKTLSMEQLPLPGCVRVCVCVCLPVPTESTSPHHCLPAPRPLPPPRCLLLDYSKSTAPFFCPPPGLCHSPSACLFHPRLFPSTFILTPCSFAFPQGCKHSPNTFPLSTWPRSGVGVQSENNLRGVGGSHGQGTYCSRRTMSRTGAEAWESRDGV